MPQQRPIDFVFPFGGLDRSQAYQRQPPYTSPDLLNVRPRGRLARRLRGGSRPGLSRTFLTEAGGALGVDQFGENPGTVNLLSQVSYVGIPSKFLHDPFDNLSASIWEFPVWGTGYPGLFEGGGMLQAARDEGERGVVRALPPLWDLTADWWVEFNLRQYQGYYWGRYKWSLFMDDVNPNVKQSGVEIILELPTQPYPGGYGLFPQFFDRWTGYAVRYEGGSPVETIGLASNTISNFPASDSWSFRLVHIVSTGLTHIYYGPHYLGAITWASTAGNRFGFSLEYAVGYHDNPLFDLFGYALADDFRMQYLSTEASGLITRLVAASNGKFYTENAVGQMEHVNDWVDDDTNVETDIELHAVELGQKLYIADHAPTVLTGTASITGTPPDVKTFTVAGIDFTALGIDTDNFVVVLIDSDGPALGAYGISSIAAGSLTLAQSVGVVGTAAFFIERAPKVYDPAQDTLELWFASAGKGSVPSGCPVITRYRGSIGLAGAPWAPHVWYLSRQFDPFDWDFGAEPFDTARAISGTNSDAGTPGEGVTAWESFSDDYSIMLCIGSTYIMRGDPRRGGRLDQVSDEIGCVNAGAVCRTPEDIIVFVSRKGLYALPPGASGVPAAVSENPLPAEFRNLDTGIYSVFLEFDLEQFGINIFIVHKEGGGVAQQWWLDWKDKTFWPESFPASMEPFSTHKYVRKAGPGSLLLRGCRDGFIRRSLDGDTTDDGTAIDSYAVLGPMKLGGSNYREGMLRELVARMPINTSALACDVHVGKTAELALPSNSPSTKQILFKPGFNYTHTVRRRGHSMCLKLSSQASEEGGAGHWALEELSGVVKRLGKPRKG